MADVAGAFIRGRQAGQAEIDQQQEREARGLHALVLRHELSRLKVQDALEDYHAKNAAAAAQFGAQEGRPSSIFPQQAAPTTIPTTSAFGMPSAPNQAPETVATTAPVVQPVQFPGLPTEVGGGSPGYSRTPRTAEDLVNQMIRTKQLENDMTIHNVPEGGTLVTGGGRTVATGKPKTVILRPGSQAVEEGTGKVTASAPAAPARPQVVNGNLVDANGKVIAKFPKQAEPGMEEDRRSRAGERKDRHKEAQDRAKFEEDFKQYTAEQREHELTQRNAPKVQGTDAFGIPAMVAPPYEPFQPFAEWQAKRTPPPAAATTPAPAKPSASSAPAFKKDQIVTLKNGKKVKVLKAYPDGSFDPDPNFKP